MNLFSIHPLVTTNTSGFNRFRRLFALTTALAAVSLSGCVIASGSRTTTTGSKIADATFAQIEPGKTRDSVVELLGEPSEKINNVDGTELWHWRYTENHHSGGGFIFLFATTNDTKTVQTRYVEFKNGIVTWVWTE